MQNAVVCDHCLAHKYCCQSYCVLSQGKCRLFQVFEVSSVSSFYRGNICWILQIGSSINQCVMLSDSAGDVSQFWMPSDSAPEK